MKKAFTLIEVIATLVILAIIALIAIPIVNNIIDKSEKTSYKRSVDNYAHAIENAIMTYKMEHGRYATDVNQLTIEYSGYKVKCNEIELNKNGTVYLNKCYVNNTKVKNKDKWYSYGKIQYEYNVGDIVTYKDNTYHVIRGSKVSDEYVSLLKDEPLKYNEISKYSDQVDYSIGWSRNYSRVYYSSDADFSDTNIKRLLDLWANDNLDSNDLYEDDLGYKIRLVTYEELSEHIEMCSSDNCDNNGRLKYEWMYNNNYEYWTMTKYEDSAYEYYFVDSYGNIYNTYYANSYMIRPVINLKKETIGG